MERVTPPAGAASPTRIEARLLPGEQLLQVPVDGIVVTCNVRRRVDDEALLQLTESVRQVGVLQPLLLNANPDRQRLELVCGERRLRAARAAGLATVPAIVRVMTSQEVAEAQMVENLQRADLDPIEEAFGFKRALEDLGYTQERLAERLGVSPAHISNRLRLLRLPPEVQDHISHENLHAGHGLALLRLVPEGGKPSPLFRNVVRAMVECRPPVAEATEFVLRQVHSNGRRLQLAKESWQTYFAKFDYREQCKKVNCPFLIEAKGWEPLCADPPCYDRKQKAASAEWEKRRKELEAKRREEQLARQREEAKRERERRAKEAAKRAASAAGDVELPRPESVQTVRRIDTKAPPAGPPAYCDIAAAARMREIGTRAWSEHRMDHFMPTSDFERECLVTLDELLGFFVRRQQIGATRLPVQFGDGELRIPEQQVTIRGGDEGERIAGLGIEDGQLRLVRGYHVGGGEVSEPLPAGRLYYRVAMGGTGGTKAITQQVVVPGVGRHLVLTGTANMLIRKDLLPRLQALINALPGFPAVEATVVA